MTNQLELFESIKCLNVQYPRERYPLGYSPCHWFHVMLHEPFHNIVSKMPPNSIYLELGSFLGAGSTKLAMQSNPTLRAYCCDHFRITSQVARKFPTQNASEIVTGKRRKIPVAYLRGEGSSLEHFLNNTFEWRNRIIPMMQAITVEFLYQLKDLGVVPDLILIDDDHQHTPVFNRLEFISKYWPNAQVLLDDFTPSWDGVRTGVQAAFDAGCYPQTTSRLLAGRLMLLEGSPKPGVTEAAT